MDGWRAEYEKRWGRLNPYQRAIGERIANITETPMRALRVVAVPGSGKTATVTTTLAHILTNDILRPEEILVGTFTRAGAVEMKGRLDKMAVPAKVARLRMGTLHSIAGRWLSKNDVGTYPHRWRNETNNVVLGRPYSQGIILSAIFGDGRVKLTEGQWGMIPGLREPLEIEHRGYSELPSPSSYLTAIDCIRAKGLTIGSPAAMEIAEHLQGDFDDSTMKYTGQYPHFVDVWKAYDSIKKAVQGFDFSDVLHRYWELGKDSARLVLTDEAQDSEFVQVDSARKVAENGRGRLALVGDIRQSIFRFKGADPELMLTADKTLGADTMEIPTNYRSAKRIVDVSNDIVRGQPWSIGADAIPARRDVRPDGAQVLPDGIVRTRASASEFSEATDTAREIRDVLRGHPLAAFAERQQAVDAAREEAKRRGGKWATLDDTQPRKTWVSDEGQGLAIELVTDALAKTYGRAVGGEIGEWVLLDVVPPNEIAVLCRTNRGAAAYEMACLVQNVPCMTKGKSFFDRFEIQNALALCQLSGQIEVPAIGQKDQMGRVDAFLRIWKKNGRFKYMKKADAEGAITKAFQQGTGMKASEVASYALRPLLTGRSAGRWADDLHDVVEGLSAIEQAEWPATAARVIEFLGVPPFDPVEEVPVMKPTDEDEDTAGVGGGVGLSEDDSGADLLRQFVQVAAQFKSYGDLVAFAQKLGKWTLDSSRLDRLVAEFEKLMSSSAPNAAARRQELQTEIDDIRNEVKRRVFLGTSHSAKGREWRLVYVAASAGQFPHFRSINDPEQLAEEHRLFYVAFTRGKDAVVVTNYEWRPGRNPREPEYVGPSRYTVDYVQPFVDRIARNVPIWADVEAALLAATGSGWALTTGRAELEDADPATVLWQDKQGRRLILREVGQQTVDRNRTTSLWKVEGGGDVPVLKSVEKFGDAVDAAKAAMTSGPTKTPEEQFEAFVEMVEARQGEARPGLTWKAFAAWLRENRVQAQNEFEALALADGDVVKAVLGWSKLEELWTMAEARSDLATIKCDPSAADQGYVIYRDDFLGILWRLPDGRLAYRGALTLEHPAGKTPAEYGRLEFTRGCIDSVDYPTEIEVLWTDRPAARYVLRRNAVVYVDGSAELVAALEAYATSITGPVEPACSAPECRIPKRGDPALGAETAAAGPVWAMTREQFAGYIRATERGWAHFRVEDIDEIPNLIRRGAELAAEAMRARGETDAQVTEMLSRQAARADRFDHLLAVERAFAAGEPLPPQVRVEYDFDPAPVSEVAEVVESPATAPVQTEWTTAGGHKITVESMKPNDWRVYRDGIGLKDGKRHKWTTPDDASAFAQRWMAEHPETPKPAEPRAAAPVVDVGEPGEGTALSPTSVIGKGSIVSMDHEGQHYTGKIDFVRRHKDGTVQAVHVRIPGASEHGPSLHKRGMYQLAGEVFEVYAKNFDNVGLRVT